jgi:hypothetical protein
MGPSDVSHCPFPQLIQADVGHDPVKPSMKAAIEAEGMQVAVHAKKRLLIHVPRIFRRPQQIHRKPEHTLIIGADQLLEGFLVAALSCPN